MAPPTKSAWDKPLSWAKSAPASDSQAATLPGQSEWQTVTRTKAAKYQPEIDEEDVAACTEEALRWEEEGNEARRQASELSARYGGEAGLYHSDQAKYCDTKTKEWRLKAAKAGVKDKQDRSASGAVDLHGGLTVSESLEIVTETVNAWWSSGSVSSPLQIIVGVGRHSKGNRPAIGPAVMRLLENDGWDAEQCDGIVYVYGVAEDSRK